MITTLERSKNAKKALSSLLVNKQEVLPYIFFWCMNQSLHIQITLIDALSIALPDFSTNFPAVNLCSFFQSRQKHSFLQKPMIQVIELTWLLFYLPGGPRITSRPSATEGRRQIDRSERRQYHHREPQERESVYYDIIQSIKFI